MMKVGDIVKIKEEKEVMLIVATHRGASDQVSVLREGKLQYLPVHLLETVSESR